VSRVSFICSSLLQSSASSASSAVKKLFERVQVRSWDGGGGGSVVSQLG
jgi:hypothetical protein